MLKSLHSPKHKVLIDQLIEARKAVGMTQQALADRLGRPQSFVAKYENGERRLDVVEFLEIAQIVKADSHTIIRDVEGAA